MSDEKQAKASHDTMHPTWHAELRRRMQTPTEHWDRIPEGMSAREWHHKRRAARASSNTQR